MAKQYPRLPRCHSNTKVATVSVWCASNQPRSLYHTHSGSFLAFSNIFVIGGTGAQGLPIVESLVSDGKYSCLILTRDPTLKRSQALKALRSNVELFEGFFTNEAELRRGYSSCDAAFVNIDDLNTGEMAELHCAVRYYELAVEDGGIRSFVCRNLDYAYKESGLQPEIRTGHFYGKGRVVEWI